MAGCDFGWVTPSVGGYCVGNGAATSPKNLGDSAFDDIAESAAKAASTTVKALGSAWMDLSSPDLSDDSGPVAFLRGSTLWVTTFTAVLCLLIAAGQLAWQRRGDPARNALQGLLNLVMVSSVGVATVGLLTSAGDKFSIWIIDRSTGCRQISASGEPVAQCVASSTAAGRFGFRRSVGWLLAFLLYKPAAAVVYAAAFSITGQKQDNEVVSMVSGVVLIVLACFTLPALMRLTAPVVQAAMSGTGRTGGASTATSGAAAVAVTGALPVPNLRSLAIGRSVAGAAVNPDAGGARPSRPLTARGAEGARGTPDSERPAAEPARPRSADSTDTDTDTEFADRTESTAPVPVPDHRHPHHQQEEPRGY
jgi:type IV secretion system protein TrbL